MARAIRRLGYLLTLISALASCGWSPPQMTGSHPSPAPTPASQTAIHTPESHGPIWRTPGPTSAVRPPDEHTAAISAFSFADETTGWVALGDRLLVTYTGGATWGPLATLDDPITQLVATAPSVLWARVGGRLMRSRDGGATWQELAAQLVGPTLADALDANHAWAWNVGRALFATQDGGHTWARLADPCAQPGREPPRRLFIDVLSPQLGWALCAYDGIAGMQDKLLVATNDGGQSWHEVASAPLGGVTDSGFPGWGYATGLAVSDADHIWLTLTVSAQSQVLATADGGRTWTVRGGSEEVLIVGLQAQASGHLAGLLTSPGRTQAVVLSDHDGAPWRAVFTVGVRPRASPQTEQKMTYNRRHAGVAADRSGPDCGQGGASAA